MSVGVSEMQERDELKVNETERGGLGLQKFNFISLCVSPSL